ncbi:winged helix-turn-helix transcriptional regulator [Draconibacterium orientale]|uniref:winged helix-turn-helix transcriptional regulator n=1 Tax=Draconibacterium orientale TaxID=1168034 RepID=UPI002A0A7CB2|nr:winged helix-turn-helix transcriptional regulator [Draconibacterium orientale]
MTEQQNIEYKQGWHNDYLKWICGFANAVCGVNSIDTWGRGTLKIINLCKEAGLPEPEIKELNGGIEVAVFNKQGADNSQQIRKEKEKDEKQLEEGGQISGQISGQIGGQIGGLTERQIEVLYLINGNNKISRKELSEKLKINESAVQGHLEALKKKGIIERIGSTRGYWKILHPKKD